MTNPAILRHVTANFQAFKQVQSVGLPKGGLGLHIIAGSVPLPKVVLGYQEAYYVIDEPSLKKLLVAKHGQGADTNDHTQLTAVIQALVNGAVRGLRIAPQMLANAKKQGPGPFMSSADFEGAMMVQWTRHELVDAGFLPEANAISFIPFGTPLIKLPVLVVGGSFG